MICPVCKKNIKTKSHVRRMKDDKHIEYVKKQEMIAYELYKEYKNLYFVLNDDSIFLNEYIESLLRNKYTKEISDTIRKNANKKLSLLKTDINSNKYKQKQQYINDITNGHENIDYVTCKICGFKGRQLISHLTRVHNINKKQYLNMYPNSNINSYNTNKKIALKMLENSKNHDTVEMSIDDRKFYKNIWGICGVRKDLNEFFRSTWESNIARLLKHYDIEYKYEVIKNINYMDSKMIYVVDFYLPKYDAYIEVKGSYDNISKLKIKLFKEQYSSRLFVIDKKVYKRFNKQYKNKIENWENGSKEQRKLLIKGYENI